jgi:hypothetical protein
VEARSRRLAEAAYVSADVTGEPRVAAQLLVEARRGDPQLRSSLRAAVAAAYLLLTGDGDVTAAYRLLLEALHRATLAGEEEAAARGQAIMTLLEICLYGSRPELWPSFLDVRARLDGSLPPVLRALVQVLGDPAGVTAADVALLEGQIEALEDETSPTVIERVATAAVYLDRAVDCRPALWRVVEDGRAGGAVGSGINAALVLGADAWHAGEWDLAVSVSEEAIRVCEQQGYDLLRWPLLLNLGCIAAARGDAAAVRATVTQMDAWAAPRGVGAVSMYARHLGLLDALGRADHEAAVHHAQALCRPGELAGRSTNVLWATLDWVEATAFHRPPCRCSRPRRSRAVGGNHGSCTTADATDPRGSSAGRSAGGGRRPLRAGVGRQRRPTLALRQRSGAPAVRRAPARRTALRRGRGSAGSSR